MGIRSINFRKSVSSVDSGLSIIAPCTQDHSSSACFPSVSLYKSRFPSVCVITIRFCEVSKTPTNLLVSISWVGRTRLVKLPLDTIPKDPFRIANNVDGDASLIIVVNHGV